MCAALINDVTATVTRSINEAERSPINTTYDRGEIRKKN